MADAICPPTEVDFNLPRSKQEAIDMLKKLKECGVDYQTAVDLIKQRKLNLEEAKIVVERNHPST